MKNLIWYEKYRAQKLKQLVLPKDHRKVFRGYIREGQIPHLLFYGPAGSGKTTLASILIHECASGALTLNASSNDRGIATIKKKVKQFASAQRIDDDKLNVVLFDEADGLTSDAQMALKNTIETYHKNCRFIFTANEIDKIIEPIASRCTMFRFWSPPEDYVIEFMENILINEEIRFKKKDVLTIVDRYKPDIRSMINNLQSAAVGGRLKLGDALIGFTEEEFLSLLDDGKIGKIRKLLAGTTDFVWLYKLLFNQYLPACEEELRPGIATVIADYLWRDKTVADREINVVACMIELCNEQEHDVYF